MSTSSKENINIEDIVQKGNINNHHEANVKKQIANTNDSIVSSMETIDGENRDKLKCTIENHHGSSRPKSSKLKRKKLPTARLSMSSAINESSSDVDSLREEKESRRKISAKQIILPKKDVLQQKYQELHQLLVLPLVQPVNKNALKIGQLLQLQAYNQVTTNEVYSNEAEESTEATWDANVHDDSIKLKGFKVLNKGHKPLHHEDKWRSQASTDSSNDEGYSQWVRRRNKAKQHNPATAEQAAEKQDQVKKHIFQQSDTFLKNTANPSIKQWLKKKERELRKRKREERRQLKEERLKKQEQETLKREKFKDSEQKVREWMLQKRKEVVLRTKESKETVKEEHNCDITNNADEPTGADAASTLLSGSDAHRITNVNISLIGQSRQPTPTSFVYARPVSGRVRLIKLQQENKENAKKKDFEKQLFKKQLDKEKTKKMRVSYDQWLLKKRENDYTKRQEAARMRALAKSDSELHHIGVKDAQKRINSFIRQKQKDTNSIELEMNDLSSEEEYKNKQIKILGSKKNLNIRPSSARPSLSPRISRSVHRPMSANPTSNTPEKGNAVQEKSNFKIPFPPEKGAPKYVMDKQRKIFSPHLTKSSISSDQEFNKVHATSSASGNVNDIVPTIDINDKVTATSDAHDKLNAKSELHEKLSATSDAHDESSATPVTQSNPATILLEGNQQGTSIIRQEQDPHNDFSLRSKEHIDEKEEHKKKTEKKDENSNIIEDRSSSKQESEVDIKNSKLNSTMELQHESQKLHILEQIIYTQSSPVVTDEKIIIRNGQTHTHDEFKADSYSSISHKYEKDPEIQEDYFNSKPDMIENEPTVNKLENSFTYSEDLPISKNSGKHVSFQESPVVFESSDTSEIEEDLPEENDDF